MAATAIQIDNNGTTERLYFMTIQKEDGTVDVEIYRANEEWIPIGTPSVGYAPMDEEEYHMTLRKAAHEKGQLDTSHCTHLEWNPGYNPDDYNFDKLETDTDWNDPI